MEMYYTNTHPAHIQQSEKVCSWAGWVGVTYALRKHGTQAAKTDTLLVTTAVNGTLS